MIRKFVDIFQEHKNEIREQFAKKHPEEYEDIVKIVVKAIAKYDDKRTLNAENIHVINDGDYQGTLLFLIPKDDYQPDIYFYIFVDYGSCSGCDTLQSIYYDHCGEIPTEQQVNDYMTLALHIVQSIKQIGGEE